LFKSYEQKSGRGPSWIVLIKF